jgi:hypothetical protein
MTPVEISKFNPDVNDGEIAQLETAPALFVGVKVGMDAFTATDREFGV